MIVIAEKRIQQTQEQAWQEHFLELLPGIQRYAETAFRYADPAQRAEAVQDVLANAWKAYRRLAERGKQDLAYATPLAMFAIKQVRSGRKIGSRLNVRDPLSRHAQLSRGIKIERLTWYSQRTNKWIEVMVEDHRTSIPDKVAFRIDVPLWLATLSSRDRQIAKDLAYGHKTSEVAQKHRLSAGRISQLRRELEETWLTFHGSAFDADAMSV